MKIKELTLISVVVLFNFLFIQTTKAEIILPAIVSSDMVLQRNTTIKLWGWADANEEINIDMSWLSDAVNIKADKNGSWLINVETSDSRNPQTIEIKGESSSITLENVVFGEVWLCSGQSNMEQPLRGYNGQPTFGSTMAIAKSNNPNLRLFTVNKVVSDTPLQDVEEFISWQAASPEAVATFSAVGYFFGQQLQEVLDVPVGIIHTSWAGSPIQAWVSKEVISEFQKTGSNDSELKTKAHHNPAALFNAMIHPLTQYTIKGMLWYQGESNRLEPNHYRKLFPAMVKDWRQRWEIGNFPFYYVQIAPFTYRKNNEVFNTFENSAFIREVQLECLDIIPNVGIAITMDIGAENCIHPPKKKEVANRLLFNALNKTYGYKTIDSDGPILASSEIKDDGILLNFKNAETGLYCYDTLEGFEIAGKDKVFYPATAKITNRKNVLVHSKNVPNPVAVRYAWRNWIPGSLYDVNLIPASSFRTDKWEDATKAN